MRTIELILAPAGPGRYVAMLDGEVIGKASRQPFLDASRVLLAMGYPPETELTARHASSAIIALRGVVGELARWSVTESDSSGLQRRPWAPFELARLSQRGSAPAAEEELAAT